MGKIKTVTPNITSGLLNLPSSCLFLFMSQISMSVLPIKETAHSDVLTPLEVTLAIALLVITWRLMPKPAAVRSNQNHCISIHRFINRC